MPPRHSENEAIRTRIEAANTSRIRAKHNSQCIENERGALSGICRTSGTVWSNFREPANRFRADSPATTLLDIVCGAECGNIPPLDRRDLEVLNNPPQW